MLVEGKGGTRRANSTEVAQGGQQGNQTYISVREQAPISLCELRNTPHAVYHEVPRLFFYTSTMYSRRMTNINGLLIRPSQAVNHNRLLDIGNLTPRLLRLFPWYAPLNANSLIVYLWFSIITPTKANTAPSHVLELQAQFYSQVSIDQIGPELYSFLYSIK